MLRALKRFGSTMTDVQVLLFRDVENVGKRGEIVQISCKIYLTRASMARRTIIPQQLGYYVPREQGNPILPDGWEPKIVEDDTIEQIFPADKLIEEEAFMTSLKQ